MATEHEHDKHGQVNPGVSFEISDLSPRGILGFFLVLALLAVGVHFVVYGFYQALEKAAARRDPEVSPLLPRSGMERPRAAVLQNAPSPAWKQIPEPRLETNEPRNVLAFREREEAALSAPPWQDAQGAVHLPIETAMKVLAQRGLPARAGTAPQTDYPGAGREYSGIRELHEMETGAEAAPQSNAAAPEDTARHE